MPISRASIFTGKDTPISRKRSHLLIDTVGCCYDGLSINKCAAALVLGNLDMHLIRKFAILGPLAADDPSLRRLNRSTANFCCSTDSSEINFDCYEEDGRFLLARFGGGLCLDGKCMSNCMCAS